MNIVTLTLNPAFDVHCRVDRLMLGHEHLCEVTDREAGGKGVNISRALANNGVDNLALVVLGEENADDFCRRLEADRVPYLPLRVAGRIRENMTIHPDEGKEMRISFSGFAADEALLLQVEQAIDEKMTEGSIVTMTGRVPSGIPMTAIKAFLGRLSARGVRVVIDSRSFSLSDLIESRPWLIKPNEEEIAAYLGKAVSSFEDVLDAAKSLHEQGITNVMISLGKKGALLVCDEGVFTAEPPDWKVISTIGAGDSSIAGFLAATAQGFVGADALLRAVSYGSAACLTSGTRPPEPADVARVAAQTVLRSY